MTNTVGTSDGQRCYSSLRSTSIQSLPVPLSFTQSFQSRSGSAIQLTTPPFPPMSASRPYELDTSLKPYSQSTGPEDRKASFDDLIDGYASPYAPNSKHQTHIIGDGQSHRRTNTVTLPKASASSYSLKQSDETHDDLPPLYPPTKQQVKEVDPRTFWEKVCRPFDPFPHLPSTKPASRSFPSQ